MHASLFAVFDSPFDLGAVLVVVVLLFGSSKLPKLARSLGSAQREFRKGAEEGDHENRTEPTGSVPLDQAEHEQHTDGRP